MVIGIIGTGFGKTIAQTFKSIDTDCTLFLSGSDSVKTKRIADEIGAQVIEKWEDLVREPTIDLVVIATPSALHREMFEAAVGQNKHILIEKPAATSAKDIRDMLDLVNGYPKIVIVNHAARFNPIIRHIRDRIGSGRLGDIMTVRIGSYLNIFSDQNYTGHWYNSKKSGGGQLFAVGVHQIDLARYLLDMPTITSGAIFTSVYRNPRFTDPVDAESQFSGNLMTENGTCIDLFNDSYCFGAKDFIVEIVGSKGIVKYSDTQGLRESYSNDRPLEEIRVKDPLPAIAVGNSILTRSLKYLVKELVDSIGEDSPNKTFCDLRTAADNLEIIERYAVERTVDPSAD
ncbi:MAG: Gfo/Idh/MocA family oxidoreductase [Candidatus Moranbacteria bacterium]|nr:Gfo/Idh/MocA family oxidoreductase [Candidatus Moranbacteria bacterium]